MSTKLIKRESLTEQIKAILIKRIINGELKPGDRLKELQIAQEFGTSQAPVREAIRSMQAVGYVQHKHHVGTLVKMYTKDEIIDAYQIREALEGYCLSQMETDTLELAAVLGKQIEKMRVAIAANNVEEYTWADHYFHRAIIESSNNKHMLEVWRSLGIRLQMLTTFIKTSLSLDEVCSMHIPIYEALAENNRPKAVALLAEHYRDISNYWEKHG